MYQYQIYGLKISSSRKIDLLNETEFANADLNVQWNISSPETFDNKFDWKPVNTELLDKLLDIEMWETENEKGSFTKICFTLKEIKNLNFVLDKKKENLWINHDESVAQSDIESHFVGPVLSFTLRLRGVMSLHSSVVGIDGKAIAFLGHATAGKSTIAAGMADAGAEILSDDLAVLKKIDGQFIVQTGYSKVRLRPKAAEFLTNEPNELPMVYSYRESRYFSLENSNKFLNRELPLAAIYILGEISDDYKKPFIKQIDSQKKLISLIQNTSGSYVIMGETRAEEFKTLTTIARTIPIRRLYYAHDITTLPAQCELIIRDFRELIKEPKVLAENA